MSCRARLCWAGTEGRYDKRILQRPSLTAPLCDLRNSDLLVPSGSSHKERELSRPVVRGGSPGSTRAQIAWCPCRCLLPASHLSRRFGALIGLRCTRLWNRISFARLRGRRLLKRHGLVLVEDVPHLLQEGFLAGHEDASSGLPEQDGAQHRRHLERDEQEKSHPESETGRAGSQRRESLAQELFREHQPHQPEQELEDHRRREMPAAG